MSRIQVIFCWALCVSAPVWAVEDIYTEDDDAVVQQQRKPPLTVKPVQQSTEHVAPESLDELKKQLAVEMVSIPAGSLNMGCEEGRDHFCWPWEKPPHPVAIAAFELGKYEVTQQQWQAVMGSNPSWFARCGSECPVENVSWEQVQKFIRTLNRLTGQRYRLPSEAEWEYAYRADSKRDFYSGSCLSLSNANYEGYYQMRDASNTDGKTKECDVNDLHSHGMPLPVGRYPQNPWGLFDMAGNVNEWVQDSYHANYQGAPSDGKAWEGRGKHLARVWRGGSWMSGPYALRAAARAYYVDNEGSNVIGFRLARDLAPVAVKQP